MTLQVHDYRRTPTILDGCNTPLSQYVTEPCEAQVKLDGERFLAVRRGSQILFLNRHSWSATDTDLPQLATGVKQFLGNHDDAVLDGELVAKGGFYGSEGFLKSRSNRDSLTFVTFDVLEQDDRDLRLEPYVERWKLLRTYRCNLKVRTVPSVTILDSDSAAMIFKSAVKTGMEGIVLKRHSSKYVNNAWLRLKAEYTDTVTIVGIRKTEAFKRTGVASSWLITKDGKPKGHVGSGLTHDTRQKITELLLKARLGEDSENIHTQPLIQVEISYNADLGNTYRSPRIERVITK